MDSLPWLGQSIERVEDFALLTGQARFIDDLAIRPGTLYAAILRSPHAHARITSIDATAARTIATVLTGEDISAMTTSLVVGVKAPVECWPIAVGKTRYVGEPVAVIIAADRYLAEDALDLIEVDYEVLPATIDPEATMLPASPLLHEGFPRNIASDRSFTYGDPETAFATADHTVSIKITYPRNACTPIETYGVIAEYFPGDDVFDVTANFQGPFSIHAVIARALKVPGNRLRLRTPPDSGGSFGVKQGVFPYIVLIAAAARATGRPVKWIEDRLEHLAASVSATNRVTHLEAAITTTGRITALRWDQIEDCGAHLRAPEPATLYRMHGNMTGAYDIRNIAIRNRVVVTNKTPTGLNRGFGGPQVYFALERLIQRIALFLNADPLDIIRRNLVQKFPYRTATGALLDSGDYSATLDAAITRGNLAALRARQSSSRAAGKKYGIGFACVVEPSVSNMGYITTVLTAAERRRAGPKNGAQATATISLDPLGGVLVHVASVPQGQGHRTVLSQVVADVLGLRPTDIKVVTDLDTAKDAWSIASGNYASRFAPAVAGAAHLAASRLRDRLAHIAASQLNILPEDVEFSAGRIQASGNPTNGLSFSRVAATSHWAPGTLPDGVEALRETAFWTPPELTAPTESDEVNSSLCHGFILDFCGVEIDPVTAQVRIDRYVTMHDCGWVLHPAMVAGQITGGFAHAVGAALYEEFSYAPDGSFLAGSLADYLLPTTMEVPDLEILHYETRSPFTPLGSKGVGEGNCMSTPVCIANAVADALQIADLTLPLVPSRLAPHLHPPELRPATPPSTGRNLTGTGTATVRATREAIFRMLLDPEQLAAIIPGAHAVRKLSPSEFTADVTLGIGPVKGRYRARIILANLVEPERATLSGGVQGALGNGEGSGEILLIETSPGTTRISYHYQASINGKLASIGGRLLDGAARVVIGQFFAALAARAAARRSLLTWLLGMLHR